MRRATKPENEYLYCNYKFQSTLSVRRATLKELLANYPAKFQSTLSVRRATITGCCITAKILISIHALREESDYSPKFVIIGSIISIHALREESDRRAITSKEWLSMISIHALREESDHRNFPLHLQCLKFQSTLSVRRATLFSKKYRCSKNRFQSTLSVRRATRAVGGGFKINLRISIHALREESDGQWAEALRLTSEFQSTLSVRRATSYLSFSSGS